MREEVVSGLQVGSVRAATQRCLCFEAAKWLRKAFINMTIFSLCKEKLVKLLIALKQLGVACLLALVL